MDPAPMISAVAAVLALGIAARQVYVGRASQREATANALWARYLELAIEHSDLAHPADSDQTRNNPRYAWFLSYLLFAAEQILDLSSRDEKWRHTISTQLRYHRHALSAAAHDITFYSSSVQEMITDALKVPCHQLPSVSVVATDLIS
jgi:hypothetical protein